SSRLRRRFPPPAAEMLRTCRSRRSSWNASRSDIRDACGRRSRTSTSSWRPERRSPSSGRAAAGRARRPPLCFLLASRPVGRAPAEGIDTAGIDPVAWRRQLAWVPQRPSLLRGTVAENIRLAEPQAGFERVRAAAALGGADDFVRALPDGYETVVGDGGRPL